MVNRLKQKHKAYMDIAVIWSTMSRCLRKKVGCIIVKNDTIISDGFNGTPSGFENNCENGLGKTLDIVVHSEFNAISKAAKNGISLKDSCIYLTFSPCINCAKLILQSGVKLVIYLDKHSDESGVLFLNKSGLSCLEFKTIL